MQPVSSAFADAVVRSHTIASRALLLDSATLVPLYELPGLIDGQVSTDRERRRAAQLTFANASGELTPASSADPLWLNRVLQVQRGIVLPAGTEWVTLGTFVIDVPSVGATSGTISVTGQDRMKFAQLSSFTRPAWYDQGTPVGDVVQAIAQDAGLGTLAYRIDDAGRSLGTDRAFEIGDNRVDAIRQLERDFALSIYLAADGYLVVEPAPTSVPAWVWHYAPGEDGLLLDLTKSWNDDRLYNHTLVTGEASDMVPIRGEARDLNPDSPAYNPPDGTGPIGDRLYTYSSALVRDEQQAQDVADALLLEVALVEEQLTLPTVAHPALEAGDVVHVVEPTTATEDIYIVDTLSVPLADGGMTMTARKVRPLS